MGLSPDTQLHLVNSIDEAMEMKRWLGERREILGLDTETGGLHEKDPLNPYSPTAKLRMVQIGDHRAGWAVPWEQWGGVVLECLNAYEGPIAVHNLSFDAAWMELHAGWKVPWDRMHDTMIHYNMLYPGEPAALKKITDRHIDPAASIGQRQLDMVMKNNGWDWRTIPVDNPQYAMYSALDPVITAHIWSFLRADQKYPKSFDLEMSALRICTEMEMRGIPVDVEYSRRKREEIEEYVEKAKAWAKDALGISITSSQQLAGYFENTLGARITKRTPGGAPSVDKDTLAEFSNSPDSRVSNLAKLVLSVREQDKVGSSYFDNFINLNTNGILHPSIKTMQAKTGRMSITNPALQTLPSNSDIVRMAITAREDNHSIISSDLDQVEFRIFASFSNDANLIQTFLDADATGGDAFTSIGAQVYRDPNFQKSDPRRKLIKGCVPLTSEILTQRGWLTYDQVKVGDTTPGYNLETKKTEWTEIKGVHVFDNADIFKMSNGHRTFFCTDDHRWVVDNGQSGDRALAPKIIHANEFIGGDKRLILAAEAEDGDIHVTDDEAYLVGWILGDGSTKSFVGSSIYMRDLLGHLDIHDKKTFDPWKLAARLPLSARREMLRGLNASDGKYKGPHNTMEFVQASSSTVVDLISALGFFAGKYVSTTSLVSEIDAPSSWQKNPCTLSRVDKGTMTNQKVSLEPHSVGDVWCVTTGLGTWTMRQEHSKTPVVTGNTIYGRLYGASVAKQAATSGVPVDVMQQVNDALDQAYPGMKTFQREQIRQVEEIEKYAGQGYVETSVTGRKIPVEAGKAYTGVNYKIQGTAAEVLKANLVRLDAAGLGEYLVVPVHDEIIISAPTEDALDIKRIAQECMTTTEGWAVPLTAGADGPFMRWGDAYAKK